MNELTLEELLIVAETYTTAYLEGRNFQIDIQHSILSKAFRHETPHKELFRAILEPILNHLAAHPKFNDRSSVAIYALQNESCPPDLLARAVRSTNRYYQRYAAENPNTPEEVLVEYWLKGGNTKPIRFYAQ
jgi:recombinational DNA repair protein (RecF pathway)